MSLELVAVIICDTCGLRAVSSPCHKFTQGGWWAGKHRQALEKMGWFTLDRGQYHKQAHYCPKCADKPMAPIKGPPRWKGPEITDPVRAALTSGFIEPRCWKVWVLLNGADRLTMGSLGSVHTTDEGRVLQWNVRGKRKPIAQTDIEGWISNEDLKEILGFQPQVP